MVMELAKPREVEGLDKDHTGLPFQCSAFFLLKPKLWSDSEGGAHMGHERRPASQQDPECSLATWPGMLVL